jgi:hypothetical protein
MSGITVVKASFLPTVNDLDIPAGTDIQVVFNGDLDPATVDADTFRVFRQFSDSSAASGTFIVSPDDTIQFTPDKPFEPGETVRVVLTSGITEADTTPISSYQFQFTVEADPSGVGTGAFAGRTLSDLSYHWSMALGDLDGDGDLDFVENNDSGHASRVWLNQPPPMDADALTLAVTTPAGTGHNHALAVRADSDCSTSRRIASCSWRIASISRRIVSCSRW